MKERHFRVRVKEVGSDHYLESEFRGFKTREEIIEFYGLNQPDVVDYTIEELTDKKG